MYQTRLVKADLSLRVPLALSRRSSLSSLTFSLSLSHQDSFPTRLSREEFFLLSASEMKRKPRRASQPRKFDHLDRQ